MHNKYNDEELTLGLQLLDIPYDEQLKKKKKTVKELFKATFKRNINIKDMIGMKNPYHYRNKVQVVVGTNKKGKIITGMYQENTHKLVALKSSVVHDKKVDEIISSIKKLMNSFRVSAYNEDTKNGLIRHLLIKRGFSTSQIMVVIVVTTDMFPGRNNFVKELRKLHPEITTIIQNINSRKTSIVLGDKERVLYGKGYITDILCGLKFNISSKSFYQVNPIQTEILYKKTIEYANLKGKEIVLDAYCGIGTIGLIASKKAKEVIGVEVNKDAVRDAINNAKINNIKNVRFHRTDASLYISKLTFSKQLVDIVFIDPPRVGCDEEFLRALIKLKPKKIGYISCNPVTLVRDLKILNDNDYKIHEVQPIDMFPHTKHVENVVLLETK